VQTIPLEGGKSRLSSPPLGIETERQEYPSCRDDTDASEWGVHPQPGYELIVSDEDMKKIYRQRRGGDVFGGEKLPDVNLPNTVLPYVPATWNLLSRRSATSQSDRIPEGEADDPGEDVVGVVESRL
jgi:hypothetical protein